MLIENILLKLKTNDKLITSSPNQSTAMQTAQVSMSNPLAAIRMLAAVQTNDVIIKPHLSSFFLLKLNEDVLLSTAFLELPKLLFPTIV